VDGLNREIPARRKITPGIWSSGIDPVGMQRRAAWTQGLVLRNGRSLRVSVAGKSWDFRTAARPWQPMRIQFLPVLRDAGEIFPASELRGNADATQVLEARSGPSVRKNSAVSRVRFRQGVLLVSEAAHPSAPPQRSIRRFPSSENCPLIYPSCRSKHGQSPSGGLAIRCIECTLLLASPIANIRILRSESLLQVLS
jgi:hypothetical protein